MLSISTWHPASSVSHAVKCHLHSNEVESLVIGKVNRLEVFDLLPEGLTRRASLDLWGTITSLASFNTSGQPFDTLSVSTDAPKPHLLIVNFDASLNTLSVAHSLSLKILGARPSEYFSGTVIHPSGRVLISSVYVGSVKVTVLKSNSLEIEAEFDCRIPELNIHSLCFLPSNDRKPVLVILYEDHDQKRRIVARELDIEERELSFEASPALPESIVQDEAQVLIPVPLSRNKGGLVVLGGGSCNYFAADGPKGKRAKRLSAPGGGRALSSTSLRLAGNIIYSVIDDSRIILGDNEGRISLLLIEKKDKVATNAERSLMVSDLGEVSPASCIVHLNGGLFYIGSHFADSSLIKISPDDSGDSGSIRTLESLSNLSPIMDAVLADPEETGQAQVVTCSGGSTMGSLRVIRDGAEFKQTCLVHGIPYTTATFSLRLSFDHQDDALMLVSTPFHTHVWEIASPSGLFVEQGTSVMPGFIRAKPTLAACTLQQPRCAIQVTSEEAVIVDLVTGRAVYSWLPPDGGAICAAAVNPSQAIIALQGGRLVYLSTKLGISVVSEKRLQQMHGLPNEVSALSAQPTSAGNIVSSNWIAVGFWSSNSIAIFRLPNLEYPSEDTEPWVSEEPHTPTSILLHSFGENALYLFVGLGDGSVVSYHMTSSGLKNRKVFGLGAHTTVKLCSTFPEDKTISDSTVIAVGDRGAIFWVQKGRLCHSALPLKDITAVTPLNHPQYIASLGFSNLRGDMMVGRVGELNHLNIRTVPFGRDNPQKIAYHHTLRVYGVGCTRSERDYASGYETVHSSLKIVDAITLECITAFSCDADEEITAVGALSLSSEISPYPKESLLSECLVLGTARAPTTGNQESTEGRILVFAGSDPNQLHVVAKATVPGCVYALADYEGRIAAAVNSCVFLFALQDGVLSGSSSMVEIAKWDRGYIINDIIIHHDCIAISDALRSIDLLKLVNGKLKSVARDHSALWPVRIQGIANRSILAAEMDLNLALFRLDSESKILERNGGFHYGELVNKFIRVKEGKIMACTSTGRIAVLSDLDHTLSLRLSALQRNLGYVVKGPGGRDHDEWRSPMSAQGVSTTFAGFIDGDFIEEFVDMHDSDMEKVLSGRSEHEIIRMTRDSVAEMVQNLKSIE